MSELPAVPSDGPFPVRLKPHDRIGEYEILTRLGRGGMGEVWAAVYTGREGFEKEVALKLVRAPSFDSETAVMFVDEARATAALAHPSIVRTFDLGRHEDWIYIAMELVKGVSLNALLGAMKKSGDRMTPTMIAHVGLRMAAALDYAHGRANDAGRALELVHRDVSPHNIMVDRTGGVRLTDFGIARTAIQAHVSMAGVLRGKPGYLSPEQATGGPIDQKTDVFSLCIVLHECATGRRLFHQKDFRTMLAALVTKPVPRLSELLPELPRRLATLIDRGLSRDPTKRPTHEELVRAFGSMISTLPGHSTVEPDLATLVRRVIGDVELGRVTAARIPSDASPPAIAVAPRTRSANDADGLPLPTPRRSSLWRALSFAGLLFLAGTAGYLIRDAQPERALPATRSAPSIERPPVTARARPVPLQVEPVLVRVPPTRRPTRSTESTPKIAPEPAPPPPPVSAAVVWAQLERLSAQSPEAAEALRFELTEALASGSTPTIRAVAERIRVAANPAL